MNVPVLMKALDNEENSHLLDLTNDKIRKIKLDILKELGLDKSRLLDYLRKLDNYMYIDGMNELKYGAFIRWIPITDPDDLHLTKGGIFCDLKIMDEGVQVVYKSFFGKHYQIKMDECLIFQKMSAQEQVLLSALDHLDKK